MMYCVDLRSKVTHQSVLTIFQTNSHDRAWDVANNYNEIHGNTDDEIEMLNNESIKGWSNHPYWATVYDDSDAVVPTKLKEEKDMKKYTINDYEAFSREALDVPPIEQFEDGTIDEGKWYEDNKIIIIKGEHQMEIDYTADSANEIDAALKEMYEVEMDIRYSTTGNTVGSEYRPAELKDILRVVIQNDWEASGVESGDFAKFIRDFVKGHNDITNIMGVYDNIIYKDIKWYTHICQCNFGKLDMLSLRNIDSRSI